MNILSDHYFGARLADGVTKHGFRKWYERQLLSSHAHMLLALLSFFAMLAGLEGFTDTTGAGGERLVDLLLALACGAVALWAMRRYLYLLMRAEALAHQANCHECGEYGRFHVLSEDRPQRLTQVCCRRCDHRWTIADN
ncbi:hypothetical protein WG922_15200 [Ramlibacter sp. AN1015]|uniref:hypothetical protein n=1 Tax=Ramlibacter sp. AN1015 TaxID=3133428 RepID=UPI0030C2FD42